MLEQYIGADDCVVIHRASGRNSMKDDVARLSVSIGLDAISVTNSPGSPSQSTMSVYPLRLADGRLRPRAEQEPVFHPDAYFMIRVVGPTMRNDTYHQLDISGNILKDPEYYQHLSAEKLFGLASLVARRGKAAAQGSSYVGTLDGVEYQVELKEEFDYKHVSVSTPEWGASFSDKDAKKHQIKYSIWIYRGMVPKNIEDILNRLSTLPIKKKR